MKMMKKQFQIVSGTLFFIFLMGCTTPIYYKNSASTPSPGLNLLKAA